MAYDDKMHMPFEVFYYNDTQNIINIHMKLTTPIAFLISGELKSSSITQLSYNHKSSKPQIRQGPWVRE